MTRTPEHTFAEALRMVPLEAGREDREALAVRLEALGERLLALGAVGDGWDDLNAVLRLQLMDERARLAREAEDAVYGALFGASVPGPRAPGVGGL